MRHSFIVPLIGGQVLGQERALGSRPEYLLSYSPFNSNDSHIVNYYKDVPYHVLDQEALPNLKHVDIIGTTCPCAGLSTLSHHASPDAAANDWMYKTAEFVLETLKPEVFWGENSPQFAGKIGRPVVQRLAAIARMNGYTMSIYRTKSLLHGIPQVRERAFYFFWRGDRIPILNYFNETVTPIENLLDSVSRNASQHDLTNDKTPSEWDVMYKYVLDVVEKGVTHKQFYGIIDKTTNPMDWLEHKGYTYYKVADDMRKLGHDRIAARCDRIAKKLDAGGSIMRRCTTIPKHHIGAFVGHLPTSLTHYSEDRYLTVRECMSIMGLPEDFELLKPKSNLNHICQNVPVGTATHMASEIMAVVEGKRPMVNAYLLLQSNHRQSHEILDYQRNTITDFISTV
jgi:site-specific DNA-cytosine methylase